MMNTSAAEHAAHDTSTRRASEQQHPEVETTSSEEVPLHPIAAPIEHMVWVGGDASRGHLRLLDQTQLPVREVWLECESVESVREAIQHLSVRGAPAIGIAAAYACILAGREAGTDRQRFEALLERLATSRPTAVNLRWAIERMKQHALSALQDGPAQSLAFSNDKARATWLHALLNEARRIHDEDRQACRAIGEHALELIESLCRGNRRSDSHDRSGAALTILTHCNAGALATGGIGTATAPMYVAHERGMNVHVLADETRPLLQGSRLTAWELARAGIDVSIITDSMAGMMMRSGGVHMVITGADRIAANGDTANKIGTYALAVLAKYHGLPFIIAAPTSTIDLATRSGEAIPIEERASREIIHGFGTPTGPEEGVGTKNPAFDVTPAELITAIVTEKGLIQPVNEVTVRLHMER